MSNTKDEPLVLLHGYPFDHTLWFGVVAALGAGIRVILPDLPGFGEAPALKDEKPSLEYYADYLAQYLDSLNVEKVIVGGMSMGGYVALAFAEKYPHRVTGLALISTQAAADTDEARKARTAMIKRIESDGSQVAAQAIALRMFGESKPVNPDSVNAIMDGAQRAGAAGLIYALKAMASRPNRTEFLKSLTIPVAVAHGSEDKIISQQQGRAMAEQCKNPLFSELKGAGHATPLEAPDGIAGLLARLILKVRQQQNTETPGAGPLGS